MKQDTIKMEETRKQLSKSEVIESFIGIGMAGFFFWNWTHASCEDCEQFRVFYKQKMLIKWQKKIK